LANSDGTLVGNVTLDGYIQSNYNLVVGTTRSANTDSQISDTINNILYSLKVTVQREGDNAAVAGSTVTAGDSYGITCAENATTGIHYCVIPVTHTDIFVQIVNGAYDYKRLTYTDRTVNTDSQGSLTATLSTGSESPIISNVVVGSIATSTATITWTTDVSTATNTVEYGTTSALGSSQVTSTGDNQTSHSASLTGLAPNTLYYYKVKSSAGGTTKESDMITFTTAPSGVIVTGISATKSYATADGTYTNGWAWTFNVTVPTAETSLQMKFADWTSGSNSIAVVTNMRFYSSQAVTAVSQGTAIDITNTYGSAMTLTGDLDSSKGGRQIQITVEAKVPSGSSAGSYSTSYGVNTS